jgi:hypothetical protein
MRALSRAALLILVPQVLSLPHVARAEDPFTLELVFEEGVEPCFTRDELMHAVVVRLAAASAREPNLSSLSIRAQIGRAGARGLRAAITSHDADSDDVGQREIEGEEGCEALVEPLSLVIALVVDRGPAEGTPSTGAPPAEGPAPDASAPTETPAALAPDDRTARELPPIRAAPLKQAAPPPPVAAPTTPRDSPGAISTAGGVGLGVLPQPVTILSVSARLELTPPSSSAQHVSVVSELGTDLFVPQQIARADRTASIDGVAVRAAACGFWHHGPRAIGFEPCAGLWLRLLRARSTTSSPDARQFALFGWSVSTTLYGPLGGSWSAFASAQAWIPFAVQTMELDPTTPTATPTARGDIGMGGPFFNSDGKATTSPPPPAPTSGPLQLYRTPVIGGAVLAGIAYAL